MEFPGFPSNGYDFRFADVGPALAGLIFKDTAGVPRAGVMPSRDDLVRGRADWFVAVSPFVAVRTKNRAVLLGGSDEEMLVAISPAPAANARLDVVYSLPADVDAGDPVRAVAVAQGVAGAVPSKPAIPAGAVELATVRVSASNTSTGQAVITNTFRYTCTAGGQLRVRIPSDLVAITALEGTEVYCMSDKAVYVRLSDQWVADGKAGTLSQPAGAWTSHWGDPQFLHARTVLFDVPITIVPARQRLAIDPIGTGSGFGWAEVASVAASADGLTRVNMRQYQAGSDQPQPLTILWRLVALR